MTIYQYNDISNSITCFMGKQRATKTISAVKKTAEDLIKIKENIKFLENKNKLTELEQDRLNKFNNFELWSNLTLNKKIFGTYRKISVSEIRKIYEKKEDIKNKLILLDDLFKDYDSRNSMSKENIALSHFTTEIGKLGNILNYVSHFSKRIEIRLRDMTENFIWCRKGNIKNISFIHDNRKYIIKNLFIDCEDYYKTDYTKKELKKLVSYQKCYKEYIDFANDFDISKKVCVNKNFFYIYKYFKYYKTDEVI